MSTENFEHFMKQVADSKELQAKIGAEITGDTLVALGAAHGCEFSIEDVLAGPELSNTELDTMAGGVYELKNVMARLGPKVRKMKRRPNDTFSYTEYDDTGSSKIN